MKAHIVLTALWLSSFVIAFGVVLSYAAPWHPQLVLLPREVPTSLQPISIFYGAYIGTILTFWYFRPFKPATTETVSRVRFVLAVITAFVLNAVVIAFVAQHYIDPGTRQPVVEAVRDGVRVGGWLSFLVAPANAYYFGTQTK